MAAAAAAQASRFLGAGALCVFVEKSRPPSRCPLCAKWTVECQTERTNRSLVARGIRKCKYNIRIVVQQYVQYKRQTQGSTDDDATHKANTQNFCYEVILICGVLRSKIPPINSQFSSLYIEPSTTDNAVRLRPTKTSPVRNTLVLLQRHSACAAGAVKIDA